MSVSYPTPTVPLPATPARPPSAGIAETLVLVALVLQAVGGAIVLGIIGWLVGFSILYPYPFAWLPVTLSIAVGAVVVVFLYYAYTLSYRRIRRGEFADARTPTLVIGILSLFVGVLPGIFYILGYVKLEDALREQSPREAPAPPPPSAPPRWEPQATCAGCGRLYPARQFLFCPNCGTKLGA